MSRERHFYRGIDRASHFLKHLFMNGLCCRKLKDMKMTSSPQSIKHVTALLVTLITGIACLPTHMSPDVTQDERLITNVTPDVTHDELLPIDITPDVTHDESLMAKTTPEVTHDELLPNNMALDVTDDDGVPTHVTPDDTYDERLMAKLTPDVTLGKLPPIDVTRDVVHEEGSPTDRMPVVTQNESLMPNVTPDFSHDERVTIDTMHDVSGDKGLLLNVTSDVTYDERLATSMTHDVTHDERLPTDKTPNDTHDESLTTDMAPDVTQDERLMPNVTPDVTHDERLAINTTPDASSDKGLLLNVTHDVIYDERLTTSMTHDVTHGERLPTNTTPDDTDDKGLLMNVTSDVTRDERLATSLTHDVTHDERLPADMAPDDTHDEGLPANVIPDVTYDELIELKAACKNRDSCKRSTLSEDVWEANCQCDAGCATFDTCCVDSEFRPPRDTNPFTCVEVYGNPLKEHVFMVAQCASGWDGDESIREQCLSDGLKNNDPLLLVPLTSNKTGLTYKNYFCFLCNEPDADSGDLWDMTVESEVVEVTQDSLSDMEYTHNGYFGGWRLKGKKVKVIVDTREKSPLRRCRGGTVKGCAGNWTDDAVAAKCGSYMAMVTTTGDNQIRYQNPHCAICNFVDPSTLKCDEKPHYERGFHEVKFAEMFRLGYKAGRCPRNEVFDRRADKCRPFKCGRGKVKRDGKCVDRSSE